MNKAMRIIQLVILIALLFGNYAAGAGACAEMPGCGTAALADNACCDGAGEAETGCAEAACEGCMAHSALAANSPPLLVPPSATPGISRAIVLARDITFVSLKPPDCIA